MDSVKDALKLEPQMAFYGAYHSNKTNVLIHMICVPLILWTTFLFFDLIPFNVETKILGPSMVLSPSVLGALFWGAGAIVMEPKAGTAYTLLLLVMAEVGQMFIYPALGTGKTIRYALAIHIFSWIGQFVGHGVHEKRKPALLDSLFQSFYLAPFFVFLEYLFSFKYRPDLQQRLQKAISKRRDTMLRTERQNLK